MTKTERIEALEARLAELEAKVALALLATTPYTVTSYDGVHTNPIATTPKYVRRRQRTPKSLPEKDGVGEGPSRKTGDEKTAR